jgi:hypothetical protein
MSEHHDQLYGTLGFDEGAALIVHWGSTKLDVDAIGRILHDDEDISTERENVSIDCPVVNSIRLYGLCTNLGHLVSFSVMWETFHPGQVVDLKWHDAEQDTSATIDLLRIFMAEMAKVAN